MSDSDSDKGSDIVELAKQFAPRSAEEMEKLSSQLMVPPRIGHQYVAQAAPGYDVEGLWHTFPCHGRTGYAAHACALHSTLDGIGVPTQLVPHPMMQIDVEQFPKDREERLLAWHKNVVGVPAAVIGSFPPDLDMLRRADSQGPLAFYVAFEATKVSAYGAQICNHPALTRLWCVSDFTARSYIDAGVDASKVRVVTPAICGATWAQALWRPARIQSEAAKSGTFIFGAQGTWHERKGFHDLIRAYFSAFKRTDDVELHIRTSYFGSQRLTLTEFERLVVSEIATIAREFGDESYPSSKRQPRIRLLTGTALTDAEVVDWLGFVDAYVNPSYGEGLGIPPIWAAAQGVPVISSSFGAVGELFARVDASYLFDHKLVPVPSEMFKHSALYAKGAEWGGYEVEDLATQLKSAFQGGRYRSVDTAMLVRHLFGDGAAMESVIAAVSDLVDQKFVQRWNLT